uniref:Uncharacterized protein n=1 Tax=Arion vulgaris TaxID=1028688 RepID=A0A0B7AEK4_9EUPU
MADWNEWLSSMEFPTYRGSHGSTVLCKHVFVAINERADRIASSGSIFGKMRMNKGGSSSVS